MPSNWTEPVIDEMVAAGRVRRAPTLEDLARILAIDPAGLQASVDRYNDGVRSGEDAEFGKDAKVWDKSRIVIIPDHYIFTADSKSNRNVDILRDFVKEHLLK